jgi:thiamine-phosphate pyrophosphorylase
MSPLTVRLCVITDSALAPGRDHLAIARAALAGGADMIQLRDKRPDLAALLPQAREIQARCRERGALFIVNDRLDLALAADADGAHVGQEDLPAAAARALLGPGKLLGVSTHDRTQAEAAVRAGADYIGFGPLFPTGTKLTGYQARGLDFLREIRAAVGVPILAIGGIALDNIDEVVRAGAGAAIISAIVAAPDIAEATRAFQARILAAGERSKSSDG